MKKKQDAKKPELKPYDHLKIEKRWQKHWEAKKFYRADDKLVAKKGADAPKKMFTLVEFPFPSGAGLHTGHTRSYTAMDVVSRKRRADGENVLFPIGWDAFGLPTENYAIKTGISPQKATKQNTDTFRRQLKAVGISFDWSREINTTDPAYYKWTQWIFLQMYKKGLAYKSKLTINWCPKDKIGLANEEVINGCCERCGTQVEKRDKEQWVLAITKYADRLDKDLDDVDYWEKIKIQQRNWIGRSEGSELSFKIKGSEEVVNVFTTRADTLFGVTYVVLAPESGLVAKLMPQVKNQDDVKAYIQAASKKEEMDRTAEGKEKTGVELKGITAINPANGQEVPVWIADYVLATYGTGAVMAVPAHDARDFEFAKKYNLEIKAVISADKEKTASDELLTEDGKLIGSGKFNGMSSEKARVEITKAVNGKVVTKYKLRDWIFSRQRYWGEPIPMVNCADCGWVPVPEKDLPVKLPAVKKYEPTDDGESPLSAISSWVKTKCPQCKKPAKRETDTMPNWAGSSWYYLRYADPKNKKAIVDPKKMADWMPVDWYNGGMEHTTLHLLYSRFWHKFLYDIGVVNTKEPYKKRTSHGLILAEGGVKMSKSLGNVVNPDDLIKIYGADTLRVYQLFMGPFDQAIAWNTASMIGSRRFIERVYAMFSKVDKAVSVSANKETESLLHKTIKKVGEDIESLGFNTAVSSLMILLNALEKEENVSQEAYETLLKLLAPFAPHVTDELWAALGHKKSIHLESWPVYDPKKLESGIFKIVVQVNSKVRATFTTETDDEAAVTAGALKLPEIAKWLEGKSPSKTFYVKGKLINLIVG
ncbi:MAG TPA: leucine--tRNA ligase [Candidatus Paceibacterota bacterium]